MHTPTLAIDIFIGINLATNIIAFFYLYFIQNRYTEEEITQPLRWLVASTIPTVYGICQLWFIERGYVTAHWAGWAVIVAVALNMSIVAVQWRQLHRIRHHAHLQKLIHAMPWVVGFGVIAFAGQIVATFNTMPLWADVIRATAGLGAALALCLGAYFARAKYPGSGIEALIIISGVTFLVLATTFIARTNENDVNLVINNQSGIYQQFIEQQSRFHLTRDAFDASSAKGKTELANFIGQFDVPSEQRLKVILPDGFVLTSDLAAVTGTRVDVTPDIRQALSGQGVVRYTTDVSTLPPTERDLRSALVVTMPLPVNSGQGTLGVMQLYLSSDALDTSRLDLQSAAVAYALAMLVVTEIVLLIIFLVYRTYYSHPMAELLDEVKNIHESHETVDSVHEHRRLKVSGIGIHADLADAFNRLINEYEQRIREMQKRIDDHH